MRLDGKHGTRDLSASICSSYHRSPAPRRHRFMPPWTQSPPEYLVLSKPPDWSAGFRLPQVPMPLNGILARAPCGASCSKLRPGSALRLSQPLSGLLASTSSTALFHAATVPELLPSERSPHENRARLPAPHAPSQLSTSVQRCTACGLITTSFTDAHASRRGSLDPLAAIGSL